MSVLVVFSLFFSGMAISAVLASKIIVIADYTVPAGVLAYAITFACTDIIGEVYGERNARTMVLAGFIAMLAVAALVELAVVWKPAPFWDNQNMFEQVLNSNSRIILGSLAAYICSQMLDIWIFGQLRHVTNSKHLWLRNNLSSVSAQLVDSIVFVSIAYYGKLPIQDIIIGQWMAKIIISLIDTPFVYIARIFHK
ncbi:queuosine precursor transporter [Endozoicomonas sp. Mp262]|uniref:queuosine precursor transporter n=1 Tax=Endozoicomonas sp. Mp262 TaxID=2919499 RepID=UPI0021DA67F0